MSDPSFPQRPSSGAWRQKSYHLTAMPMRKPRSLLDDASDLLSSAIQSPLSLFSGRSAPTAAQVKEGFDLREDELLEQDKEDDAEVDDSPDFKRYVRVIGTTEEEARSLGDKARNRRRWIVSPLRRTAARRSGEARRKSIHQ
jgi:DDB1- and CUL4-associated factor 11